MVTVTKLRVVTVPEVIASVSHSALLHDQSKIYVAEKGSI
jgi:hypothetical protein